MAETTRVDFYADPLCPWCWRTALWIRHVAKQRPVHVNWKLFSLMIANHPDEYKDEKYVPFFNLERVMLAARRHGGNDAVERLFMAMGEALHGEAKRDEMGTKEGVQACLKAAGLPESLYDEALNDPSTETDLVAEHKQVHERLAAFGVPTIALEGSDIGIFGPVIEPVPTGAEALELWEHTHWMLRQPYLWEVKRERTVKLGAQHVFD